MSRLPNKIFEKFAFSGVMALWKFGHFKLVSKISQKVFVLRAWKGERGGSVVECQTPEREVRGSRPTAAVLCPWARHFTPRKYWLITQEAMAPSRHDWKIVDWDVKPQHNGLETWSADRGWWVDYLIKLFFFKSLYFSEAMALWKLRHFKLVSNISQKLFS